MSAAKKTNLSKTAQQSVKKRRNRRRKSHSSSIGNDIQFTNIEVERDSNTVIHLNEAVSVDQPIYYGPCNCPDCTVTKVDISTMTNDPIESREKVKASREAKKLAKQQAKVKRDAGLDTKQPSKPPAGPKQEDNCNNLPTEVREQPLATINNVDSPQQVKSKDEVDRAAVQNKVEPILGAALNKEQVKAEREAKKAAKQAKKKGAAGDEAAPVDTNKAVTEMTVRDVVQTLKEIKEVAQDIKAVTAQVQALSLDRKEPEKKAAPIPTNSSASASEPETKVTPSAGTKESEEEKSKAQLKAERRAKQEAQRAAKEAAAQAKAAVKPKEQMVVSKEAEKPAVNKEKSPKPKSTGKASTKQGNKVMWFRHLYNEDPISKLNSLPINSNLHPAVIKLGVQLATRVVSGSNARCIALLDALKQMVRDYSLPAKTEFARGLDAYLATCLEFLWSLRQPSASQTNAVKCFRYHLTQLPNNVDEFDAKKTLQEEIDRYIREQIDMAGEAISIAVRNKISHDDVLLTYGCSSLIERILLEAHGAGLSFRVVVVGGGRGARGGAARDMVRRLTRRGLRCMCADITALWFIMRTVNKVLLGASALLANGCVVGAAGTAAVALAARSCNKPVLVACETHKFTERAQTDAFGYNEIGDPDELIDKDNSPLKDWRSTPNISVLNLTYDVTPPTLVTAVVTELAILPCTSAPVVLRTKMSEYAV